MALAMARKNELDLDARATSMAGFSSNIVPDLSKVRRVSHPFTNLQGNAGQPEGMPHPPYPLDLTIADLYLFDVLKQNCRASMRVITRS
jgi:hypothetical protein